MDVATRRAERATRAATDDADTWARLAVAHARSGDPELAWHAALAALALDGGAPVRHLVPAPPPPRTLARTLDATPWPGSFRPTRARRIGGPRVVGSRVADLGGGLAAYVDEQGLVAVDVFGGGVVWRRRDMAPWAVVSGVLVATRLEAHDTRLSFLDPRTGESIAAAVGARSLGVDGSCGLRLLAVDDRRLAVLGQIGRTRAPPSFMDLDGRVERRPDLPPVCTMSNAVSVSGTVVYEGTRPLGGHQALLETVGIRRDGTSWRSPAALLGAIGSLVATVGTTPLEGGAVRLCDPRDGSVVRQVPQSTSHARGVHVFPEALVSGDEEGRLFGFDRTWARRWTWGPTREADEVSLAGFADVLTVVLERRPSSSWTPGPQRRALAVLGLDPGTGTELWRVKLPAAVQLAGDATPVAGGLFLPDWTDGPVMID